MFIGTWRYKRIQFTILILTFIFVLDDNYVMFKIAWR